MLQAIYSMLSSMRSQQTNMDIIGNNVANINTIAFKSERASFSDALYSRMNSLQAAEANMTRGSGMIVNGVQRDVTAGAGISTGLSTDFMINGGGFFTVQGPQGTAYTRDGSFKTSLVNGQNYLVTADGYYVLGADNRPITVPGDASAIVADAAGNLYLNGRKFATLKLSSFRNPAGLDNIGGNMALATAASGAAQPDASNVMQGWLEASNVDMATEMSQLIVAQRSFSVLGSALQTADEMESLANSMMK